jgi:type I restriction enzyme S subunit
MRESSIVPLRRIFRVINGGTPTSDPENWNGDVPWVTPVDLGLGSGVVSRTLRTLTKTGAISGSRIVPRNSLILSTRAPIGYIAVNSVDVAFNQGCRALVPYSGGLDIRYFYYQLFGATNEMRSRGQGSTFQELSSDALASIPMRSPALEEQRRIADFLDEQVERSRRLKAALAAADALALDHRVAVINDVWAYGSRTVRLGYRLSLATSGSRSWSELAGENGEIFFRSANLRRDGIEPNLNSVVRVDPPPKVAVEASRARIRRGDVLIGITGANTGWISVAGSSVAGGYVSQHVCLTRPDATISARWLAYVMSSTRVQQDLFASQYGGTKTQLSLPDIRNLRVPVYPVEMQRSITKRIDEEVSRIDALRGIRNRQSVLLEERIKALITGAVTGRIDVTTARGVD